MNLMTTIKRVISLQLPLFDSETKFNSGTDGLVLCPFKQKRSGG
jgi:hypothetical protein